MTFWKVTVKSKEVMSKTKTKREDLYQLGSTESKSKQMLHFPKICPCCGGEISEDAKIKLSHRGPGYSSSLNIPCCQICEKHIRFHRNGENVLSWSIGLSFIMGFIFIIVLVSQFNNTSNSILNDLLLFFLIIAGTIFVGLSFRKILWRLSKKKMTEQCCCVDRPIKYLGDTLPPNPALRKVDFISTMNGELIEIQNDGGPKTLVFEFMNQSYAEIFAKLNNGTCQVVLTK